MMKQIHKILDKLLEAMCVILFAGMVIIGTYQIVVRYFLNSPSTVSEELLTYSFVWLSLLAAAYVFGKGEHMRMSFLAERFPQKVQAFLYIGTEILIILFAALIMVYGGISIVKLTMTQVTASLGIPMGIVYMVVPISGIIIVLYGILNIIVAIRERKEVL